MIYLKYLCCLLTLVSVGYAVYSDEEDEFVEEALNFRHEGHPLNILYEAICANQCGAVKDALEGLEDVQDFNEYDDDGRGLLFFAVMRASEGIMEVLLEHLHGIDVNHRDKTGKTLLHFAVMIKNVGMVRQLLRYMSTEAVNARNEDGEMALHYAMKSEAIDIELVRLLLGERPDINIGIQDDEGKTVLHYAMDSENVELVKVLLAAMNPEHIGLKDKKGRTALHYAVESENEAMIELFFEVEGAATPVPDEEGLTFWHRLIVAGKWKLIGFLLPSSSTFDIYKYI